MLLVDGLRYISTHWISLAETLIALGTVYALSQTLLDRITISYRTGRTTTGLVLFFAISLLLRLAYIDRTSLPFYFDSAEHYRIIKILTEWLASGLTDWPASVTAAYYHFGFHILAASLSVLLHIPIRDVILLLGQIILTCIPLPLFFLLRRETESDLAAFFAMLLAGFGWFMPAHALNWGKYPALAGLLTFQVVLYLAYLWNRSQVKNKKLFLGVLFFSIGLSTVTHTRSLILIGLAFASWFLAGLWMKSSKPIHTVTFCFLFAGLVAGFLFIESKSLLRLAFDPYTGDGLPITLTVLLVSPFALKSFPRMTVSALLWILLVLVGLSVPVTLPVYGYQTLLDRPLVEMVLYLPLAILAGVGLAGLLRIIQREVPQKWKLFSSAVAMLLLLAPFVYNLVSIYSFYPSDCCKLVTDDDLIALDWIGKNTSSDAVVLIASTELRLMEGTTVNNYHGSDGGIWILPLTGRNTLEMPYTTDFLSPDTLALLCYHKISFIYVGGLRESFQQSQLNGRPAWYQRKLVLPRTQVYNVIGCPPGN